MEYTFSNRIAPITGNAIRDIFKLVSRPDIISFAGGVPAAQALPAADIDRFAAEVLAENPGRILLYGATEGYAPLMESALEYLRTFAGIAAKPEELLIISGGQQGIDLACKALLNEGDRVLVENPTYLAALQIFATYQAQPYGVDMEEDGFNLALLEEAIKKHKPKMVYTVPTFANPSGRTLSLHKRKALLQFAGKYDFLILEDDPYALLRYEGEPLPSIKSMDTEGRVIYLASFSKIISPGLRVGLAVAPPSLLRKLVIGKQATDVHTVTLSQAIVDKLLRSGKVPDYLAHSVALHRERKNTMLQALEQQLPASVRFTRPEGGLFVWAELPKGDTSLLVEKAAQNKVAFIPGTHFFADGGGKNTLRLNFSSSPPDKIREGISILVELIKESIQS